MIGEIFQEGRKKGKLTLIKIGVKVKGESVIHSVISDSVTPWTVAHLCPWKFPGKNIGMGSHSLYKGSIF